MPTNIKYGPGVLSAFNKNGDKLFEFNAGMTQLSNEVTEAKYGFSNLAQIVIDNHMTLSATFDYLSSVISGEADLADLLGTESADATPASEEDLMEFLGQNNTTT